MKEWAPMQNKIGNRSERSAGRLYFRQNDRWKQKAEMWNGLGKVMRDYTSWQNHGRRRALEMDLSKVRHFRETDCNRVCVRACVIGWVVDSHTLLSLWCKSDSISVAAAAAVHAASQTNRATCVLTMKRQACMREPSYMKNSSISAHCQLRLGGELTVNLGNWHSHCQLLGWRFTERQHNQGGGTETQEQIEDEERVTQLLSPKASRRKRRKGGMETQLERRGGQAPRLLFTVIWNSQTRN